MAHSAIVTFLMASLLGGALTAPPAGETETTIHAATQEQRQMTEWALGRYEAAGLELPPIVIEFAGRDLAECDGAPGRTYLTERPIVVKMCWNNRFILLHELAHVWEAANLSENDHEPFMAMRTDVTSWAGLDVPWEQRGREHAANVIAWGLLEDPFPVSRTHPNDPEALTTAFEFLTGTSPLHDGGTGIVEPDREFFTPERANPPLESGT